MNTRLVNTGEDLPLKLEQAPIEDAPELGVVVKIAFAGICRTDAEIWHYHGEFVVPEVLGHEISGIVYRIGSQVNELEVGDHVIVNALGGCRECEVCIAGSHLCRNLRSEKSLHYGFTRNGGFQQYVVIHDWKLLLKIPEALPMHVACLLPCSGLTSYSAVCSVKDSVTEAIRIKGNASVMVIGVGSLGTFAIHNIRGILPKEVRICVADINSNKLDGARQAGADQTLLWTTSDNKIEDGQTAEDAGLFDACLDFVGSSQTITRGLSSLDQNGTIAVVGVQFEGAKVPIDVLDLTIHNKRIQGIQVGTKNQLEAVINLVHEKQIVPGKLTIVEPKDVNEVFQQILTNQHEGKSIIKFD